MGKLLTVLISAIGLFTPMLTTGTNLTAGQLGCAATLAGQTSNAVAPATDRMIRTALLKNAASAAAPSNYILQLGRDGMARAETEALARQQLFSKLSALESITAQVLSLPGPSASAADKPSTNGSQLTVENFHRKYQLEWVNDFPLGKRSVDRMLEIQELLRLMLISGETAPMTRVVALAFHYEVFDSLITYASETSNHALLRKIGEFSLARFLTAGLRPGSRSIDINFSAFHEISGPEKAKVDSMLFDFFDLVQSLGVDKVGIKALYATGELHSRWRLRNERFSRYDHVMKSDTNPDFLNRLQGSLRQLKQKSPDLREHVLALGKTGNQELQLAWAKIFYARRKPISAEQEKGFSYDENLEASLILALMSGQIEYSLKVVSAMIDNPNMGEGFYFRDLYQPELGYMNAQVLQTVAERVKDMLNTRSGAPSEEAARMMDHLTEMLTKSAANYFRVDSFSENSSNSELFDSDAYDVQREVSQLMQKSTGASIDHRQAWSAKGFNELRVQNRPIVAAEFFIFARDRAALMHLYQRVMSDEPGLFTGSRLAIVCAMAIRAIDEEVKLIK